jgi:hypothetical protein
MIQVSDLQAFVNDSSYPTTILQNCINLAVDRIVNLLNLSDASEIPDTPEVNKALLLLAASELATNVNMYWSKAEGRQIMNVKQMIAEVERILNLAPQASIVWQTLSSSSSSS